jgi:hypothetical protein
MSVLLDIFHITYNYLIINILHIHILANFPQGVEIKSNSYLST